MSHEHRRQKIPESSEVDDKTRQKLFNAQRLISPIETALERYHNSSDPDVKHEALLYSRTLLTQLRNEYDDLATTIDVVAGEETGYIIAMILIRSFIEERGYELDLLS